MRELTLTLLLVGVVIAVAVRLIDLRTKLLVVEKDAPGLGGVLEVAVRSVSRDLEGAFRGGVALSEAIRPVEDNTSAEGVTSYRDAGGTVAVRTGTDQLRLRGVIRSSRLAVEPRREPDGASVPDRILRNASSVPLRAGPPPEDRDGAKNLQSVIEHLGDPARRSKRFFFVADSAGRYAVALVNAWNPSPAPARTLEFLLDFTDPDAVSLNPGGEAGAARALLEVVTGGLLDDLVWFVAQGPEGRPPDYDAASDPPSMRFPHPYLAVAAFAGEGRWEVMRVGEDVEELQVAWGLAGTGDALTWRGEVAGSPSPRAKELVDPAGKPLLRALRIAMTAKAEHRYVRGDGPQPPVDFVPLLNAPAPDSLRGVGPVGWSSDESRRIPFERMTREVVIPTSLGR
ncbi:MAG: hypothetical protein ACXWFQ_00520 [Thermoanaerobaculia bacterium]